MIKRIYNSFVFASRGFLVTWREEFSFRLEIFIAILLSFVLVYFNFSFIESAFCIFAIIITLSLEVINTAIEDLCNKIEPNQDRVIGKIKDTMSASVLIGVVGAVIIGVMVFYHHFQ